MTPIVEGNGPLPLEQNWLQEIKLDWKEINGAYKHLIHFYNSIVRF